MTLKVCQVCTRVQKIKQKDTKFLDKHGDYVCSVECLLGWIKQSRVRSINNLPDYSGRSIRKNPYYPNANYRSKYEQSFASVFWQMKMSFKYEFVTFFWGEKEYTPDFYFPDYECFVEVKGIWNPSNRSKYKSFRETFPEIPLIIAHWGLSSDLHKTKVFGGRLV
jgi:hypothetical protein